MQAELRRIHDGLAPEWASSVVKVKDKDFLGKKVVSVADGVQVGTVKDLVFDDLNLSALVVQGERGEGLLPFAALQNNGPDAVTIPTLSAVDWNPGNALAPKSRKLHDLHKLTVMDEQGTALGHIHDFTMDAGGHIQQVEVRTEGVFGVGAHKTFIEAGQVCAIGPKLMTVKSAPSPSS